MAAQGPSGLGLLVALALALLPLVGAGCAGSGLRDASRTETPLALERVVLYRNGVAYFERQGKVRGDRLWLKVRKDQINDLLKSLAVVDRGSGQVVSISIPLDPRSWQRAALAALRPGHGNLADVLDALRGTSIRVTTGRRSVRGRITMIEQVQPASVRDEAPASPDHRLSLLDGDELQVVMLSEVRELELLDGDVALQIHRHLDASAGEGMFQQVELSIALTGADEHDLSLSYVAPAPQWKPTYRVVMDPKTPGQALLQAWAVVDNVSGENWEGVLLSLTAGEPLAFRYDLHTPREVERPDLSRSSADRRAEVAIGESTYAEASAEEASAARPQSGPMDEALLDDAPRDEAEMDEEAAAQGRAGYGGSAPRKSKRAAAADYATEELMELQGSGSLRSRGVAASPAAPPTPQMALPTLERSFAAQAQAQRVSGLTRYDLGSRVTLPDGSATMVALINQRVKGEQVFLFKPGGSGQGYEHNPYRVVRFHNDTEFALEPGPISIYAGGSFVGEGLTEAIGSHDNATIPFAVEPSLSVRSKVEHGGDEVKTVKFVRGTLEVESFRRVSTVWTVSSNGTETGPVLIRHPRQGGRFELIDPPPGVEELPDAYFVPVTLAAGAREGSVTVTEQTPTQTRVGIWDGRAVALLDTLLATPGLADSERKKLEPVVTKRREIGRIDTEVASLQSRIQELNERAEQTRRSLKAIAKDPKAGALRKKLSERLESFTGDADAIGRQIVELQSRRLELKIELEDLLESL